MISVKNISKDNLKELVVEPVIYNDYNSWVNKKFAVYRYVNSLYQVPIYYALKKGLVEESKLNSMMINIENSRNYNKSNQWTFNGELKAHQKKANVCITNAYKNDMGCILSLDCGMGKTVVALSMISRMRLKTLVIVHKEFLANQWITRIREFLPNVTIGRIQGSTIDIDKDITIGMLQSISMKDYGNIFDSFKHVIIDECHHIAAKVFSNAMIKIRTSYRLGLSATPERVDGLSKVLTWFLGDICLSMKSDTINNTIVRTIKYDPVNKDVELTNQGNVCIPRMITNIVTDEIRLDLLCNTINDIIKSDTTRKILVLSDRREHLISISKKMEYKYPTITTGLYIGGMKQESLDFSCNADVLLSTYIMTSEGFDLASLNTLIFATPKSNIHQCVGRIHRKKHIINPLIIDIVDKISIFYGQYKKREKFYKENNYEILKFEDNDFITSDEICLPTKNLIVD